MSRDNKSSGPTQRSLRVGELVRHALAAMFARGDIEDDALRGAVITVPEVRMSPDLKIANAFVMPLGGLHAEEIVAALNRHRKFVRGRVAPQINMKFAPEVRFFVDETFEEASRIDALLRSKKVQQDLDDEDGETGVNQPKRIKRAISGWVVLNKPYDMTSTQAVGKVRWLYGAAKAGHAGTLDPLATGILPIALGEATKAVPQVQDGTKIYRFAIAWGSATTTDDKEGAVVATSDVRPDQAALEAVLPQFTGTILQQPPIFSALKIDGERAYDLARAGEAVELQPREIDVDDIVLVEHGTDHSVLEVTCGKGTYVRSLARDIAETLGTRGHVSMLHRAAVGPFHDADAVTIEQLEALGQDERDALLKPVWAGFTDLPEIRLDAQQATAVRHGNAVLLTGAGAPVSLDECWASFKGEVLATGWVEFGQFKCRRVFN